MSSGLLSCIGACFNQCAPYESQDVTFNGRRFRIIRQLGEGGYAFVFLVKELDKGGREYALKKVLLQDGELLEAGKREIELNKRFKHPHILPLMDSTILRENGTRDSPYRQSAYLLFPAYKEGNLHDMLIRGERTFMPSEVLDILDQVCAAVECMHNHQPPYAHFDLKPANVLISHHGRVLAETDEADKTSAPTPQIADERGWEPLWGSDVAAATGMLLSTAGRPDGEVGVHVPNRRTN